MPSRHTTRPLERPAASSTFSRPTIVRTTLDILILPACMRIFPLHPLNPFLDSSPNVASQRSDQPYSPGRSDGMKTGKVAARASRFMRYRLVGTLARPGASAARCRQLQTHASGVPRIVPPSMSPSMSAIAWPAMLQQLQSRAIAEWPPLLFNPWHVALDRPPIANPSPSRPFKPSLFAPSVPG